MDLTEDDLVCSLVMKIDNENDGDLQTDFKREGEHDSDVKQAMRDGENNDFEAKVDSESEAEDELYVTGSPNGGNGFSVKVESESEAESEVEPNVAVDGGDDFRATVEDECESESELDGENDSADDFWAPVNSNEGSGMDENMQSGIEDDIEIDMEANIQDEVSFEGSFEGGIENYREDDAYDRMDDDMEDETTNAMGDGMYNYMEDEIVQDPGNDAANFLEDDVEDGIEYDMEENVEVDTEDASESEKQASNVKQPRRRGRPTRQKKAPPGAVYEVKVHSLAELGTIRVNSSTADIDHSMMEKIKNCLTRGQHPSTPEAEAKRALLHAKVLMKRYNVSRAEVLAHEPLSTQKQYAGQSVVFLRRVDGDMSKPVQQQCFLDYLLWAMRTFFNCKVYNTVYRKERPDGRTYTSSVEFTFYGIAENTIAAAMGFGMAYNLISKWARSQKERTVIVSELQSSCTEWQRPKRQKRKLSQKRLRATLSQPGWRKKQPKRTPG
jgi:hypothetical protein